MTVQTAAGADRVELIRSLEEIRRSRVPYAMLLSNGDMGSLISDAGGGYIIRDTLALTRWSSDRTRDNDGQWLYIQDETGACWSAGAQPIAADPDRYEVTFSPGCAAITREDHGIRTLTEISIAPDDPVEIRRCTFTNTSGRARRLTLTTYLEIVLNSPAADASHPAFSKLFVQTAYRPESEALVAWRRLRSPDDERLAMAQRFTVIEASGSLEHETDRARFVGRGRSTASPRALDRGVQLSGTTGAVLDPVFSLRRVIELPPGASVTALSVLSAHEDADEAVAMATHYSEGDVAEDAARAARDRGREIADSTNVVRSWSRLPELIGRAAYLGVPSLDDRARRDDRALLELVARSAPAPIRWPRTALLLFSSTRPGGGIGRRASLRC